MRHSIKKIIFTIALVGLLATELVQAQVSKVGTVAADFLNIGVGARAQAMGGAVTGDVTDVSALYWNPAGLAHIQQKEVSIEYANWFVDTDHAFFGLVVPLKKGVFGVHANTLNYGDFEEVVGFDKTGRTFGAYSLSVGASYGLFLFDELSLGGTAKYIMEKIDFSTASTIAFDVGTLYETPFWGIRLGVNLSNYGGKSKIMGDNTTTTVNLDEEYGNDYEPDVSLKTDEFNLPLKLRVGLAWDAIETENVRTTVTMEGESPSNNLQNLSFGVETALLDETVFIRGGLPRVGIDDRQEVFTTGIGLRYPVSDNLNLDIGFTYQGYKYLGDVSRISLGIKF